MWPALAAARLLRGRLRGDLLVVAAVKRDDEPDRRDRGTRREQGEQERETLTDVGLVGLRLELLDAVVEVVDRG